MDFPSFVKINVFFDFSYFICRFEGMRDSKEFALELFDALGRRRRLKVEKVTRDELYEFWSQITDQSFDSRLQIFFDMYALNYMINLNLLKIINPLLSTLHNFFN